MMYGIFYYNSYLDSWGHYGWYESEESAIEDYKREIMFDPDTRHILVTKTEDSHEA